MVPTAGIELLHFNELLIQSGGSFKSQAIKKPLRKCWGFLLSNRSRWYWLPESNCCTLTSYWFNQCGYQITDGKKP